MAANTRSKTATNKNVSTISSTPPTSPPSTPAKGPTNPPNQAGTNTTTNTNTNLTHSKASLNTSLPLTSAASIPVSDTAFEILSKSRIEQDMEREADEEDWVFVGHEDADEAKDRREHEQWQVIEREEAEGYDGEDTQGRYRPPMGFNYATVRRGFAAVWKKL